MTDGRGGRDRGVSFAFGRLMPYAVGSMYSGKIGSIVWVIGDLSALLTLAASFGGFIPPLVSCIVLIYYIIQIRESITIQRWLRARQLRKLVKLRAHAVEYELYLHNKNQDLSGLVDANKLHIAAETASAAATTARYEADQKRDAATTATMTALADRYRAGEEIASAVKKTTHIADDLSP